MCVHSLFPLQGKARKSIMVGVTVTALIICSSDMFLLILLMK